MKNVLLTLLLALPLAGHPGTPQYPVTEIPDALRENSHAVVREDQMTFTIYSRSRATLHVLEAITILNSNAKHLAIETIGYDKLSKVTSVKASVYDANGVLVRKLKNNEIYDQSAYDGFSLYSDNRYKLLDLAQNVYPYTVEFEYDIEFKYLFVIPGSTIIPGEKIAVQHASYQLAFPKDLAPRYKTINIDIRPETATGKDGHETLTWDFKNLKALKYESMGPPREEILPRILAAPSHFEFDGYVGNMETWEQFGQWIALLNKNRNILPEATRKKALELTAGLTTDEAKIKVLYEYLQNKTRYVSIQLGIGGFQPFEASVVDKTGYGDCKALSNYMVALLDAIGIKAHYVLIRAGDDANPIKVDFPSSQFNHVIVAVPNAKDTVWLECTSQTNPYGYMGRFTGDRQALLITSNGGAIVNTKRYSAEQNAQITNADVFVSLTGDAKATVRTEYRGLQYENGDLNFVITKQYDDQKKWMQKNLAIPSFDLASFSMTNNKDRLPSAVINTDLVLRRFATLNGKMVFLTPNLMNRSSYIPDKLESRKTKIVRPMAYTDIDTIRYHVPQEITPEFIPEPVKLKSRFGEYEATVQMEKGDLLYIRRIRMEKGVFAPETYPEILEFYKAIYRADNTKVVFINKT